MTPQHIVLSEQDTAEILQPHLGNKSALRWLRNDRNNSPSLQYEINQGQIVYRASDVVRFVHAALNPKARFIITDTRLFNEKRRKFERRCGADRRSRRSAPSTLIRDRRRNTADRRQAVQSDRRGPTIN